MKNEQLPPPNSLPGDWIPLCCHLRRGTGSSTEQEMSYTGEEPVPWWKNGGKKSKKCKVHVLRAAESPGLCSECRITELLRLENPSGITQHCQAQTTSPSTTSFDIPRDGDSTPPWAAVPAPGNLSGEEIPPNTPPKPIPTQLEARCLLSLSLVAAPAVRDLRRVQRFLSICSAPRTAPGPAGGTPLLSSALKSRHFGLFT